MVTSYYTEPNPHSRSRALPVLDTTYFAKVIATSTSDAKFARSPRCAIWTPLALSQKQIGVSIATSELNSYSCTGAAGVSEHRLLDIGKHHQRYLCFPDNPFSYTDQVTISSRDYRLSDKVFPNFILLRDRDHRNLKPATKLYRNNEQTRLDQADGYED